MLVESVRTFIKKEALIQERESVLVGVSGGTDSVALLHILHTLSKRQDCGWRLHAVHVNHGFRGEEAKEDARYVEQLCTTMGIPCTVLERDVPSYMKETGKGPQEAGREVRYRLFEEVALEVGATKLALAHHADDQVETVLFRLLRGTTLHGLGGIPLRRWLVPEQVEVVRPLLPFHRSQLEEYCAQHRLFPREDSSNRTGKYARNRLRLQIIPLLEEIQPQFREHILRLSRDADADERYLTLASKKLLPEVIKSRSTNRIGIDLQKFQSCDVALQRRMIPLILKYLSDRYDVSSRDVEAILTLARSDNPSARLCLAEGIKVSRMYHSMVFEVFSGKEGTAAYCVPLEVPGNTKVKIPNVTIQITVTERMPDWKQLPPNTAVFDSSLLTKPLYVRSRKSGDRMVPFGSVNAKKLKELLIDAKIPREWRDRLPLILAGDDIVWVPGVKRSAHALVTEQTLRYVIMEVTFGEEWREVFFHAARHQGNLTDGIPDRRKSERTGADPER